MNSAPLSANSKQMLRGAALAHPAVQHLLHVFAAEPLAHLDGRSFAAGDVDYRQGTELGATAELVVDEVPVPSPLGRFGTHRASRCTTILRYRGRWLRKARPSSRHKRQMRLRPTAQPSRRSMMWKRHSHGGSGPLQSRAGGFGSQATGPSCPVCAVWLGTDQLPGALSPAPICQHAPHWKEAHRRAV